MSRGLIRVGMLAVVVAVTACDCDSDPIDGGGEPVLGWRSAAQVVDEGVGVVSVALDLEGSPVDVDVTLPFTVGGTAVVPDDHDLMAGEVTLPAGASTTSVSLTVVDDLIAEGAETVVLTLGAPSEGELGAAEHALTIVDNEAALTVVSPNGGELWLAGDPESILWTSQGGGDTVDVEYTLDNGTSWAPVAVDTADDGELEWTVPESGSTAARVRVSSGSVSDDSDSVFEIRVPSNRWYVDGNGSGGDGTSWAQAFATMQEGAAAASAGDELWVADGIYTRSGSDNAVLVMPAGVTLFAGFDGGESERSERRPATHAAILDGEGLVDHVVIGASGALLDGFTITGGVADGADAEANGGGMFNHSVSSTMVRACVFEDNTAAELGGAVYTEASSGVLFEATRFASNHAGAGGAMVNVGSQLLVRDCVIEDNTASAGAGGVDNRDGTTVIASTTIRDNADTGGGFAGGLVTRGADRTTLVDCVLARNHGFNGGAVFADGHELAVRRSLFHDNDAEVYGGAILAAGSGVEISSSTLVRNITRGWPGVIDGWGGAFVIVNSILWDNTAADGATFGRGGSTFAVSFSDLEPGGYLDGGNNISANPNFVDASADDFRLGQASPCIDAADSGVAFTVDALGQARVDDTGMPNTGVGAPPADLGAFEFSGTTRLRVSTPNGGELWQVESAAEITWETDGSFLEVRVELSCDGGAWGDLAAATAASPGSFTWDPVLGPGGARCRVRVSDAASPSTWDETDGFFAIASNRTWHVDGGVGTPGDGSTWSTALDEVQAAVDAASFGDEVRVAAGTYGALIMKVGVDVLGGWDEGSDTQDVGANPTRLSGGGSRRVVVAADALIDGFIIENGDADGVSGWDSYGGGMLIENVSPVVTRCTFRDNQAAVHGGALFVTGGRAAPVISDCRFESSDAVNGGCVFVGNESRASFSTTVFDGCSAPLGYGGAIGSNDFGQPSLVDCTFTNNHAANGGALGYFNLPGAATVEGCELIDNSADQNGGAIQVIHGALEVTRSRFEGNDAAVRGGAIYLTEFGTATAMQLTSSLFVRNRARGSGASHGGGALYLANESTATVTNSTLFENVADGFGGAAFVHEGELVVINSILWNDSDSTSALACPASGPDSSELFIDGGAAAVSYSDVSNRCEPVWSGAGNIAAEPGFVDTGAPDLHLQAASPCVDVAHGDFLPATDFDGQTRYDHVTNDGNFGDPPYGDMGAFEYVP